MRTPIALFALFFLAGCDVKSPYTLYRNSPAESAMRIHVATFDANEDAAYNMENCQIAADLFSKQAGVTVKYWCELGQYRK